jgi:predicted ATPase
MARQLSHVHTLGFMLALTAVVRLLRREYGAALERTEEAIAVATEQGLPQWRAVGLIGRGFARAGLGQSAEGIADLRAGVAAFNDIGAHLGSSEWLGFLAAAHAGAGQAEEALAVLDRAEEK